jgi:anti-anti-sigma factor
MEPSTTLESSSSKIAITRVGSRNVLTPKGSITYQNLETLKIMFRECLNGNKTEIILDCAAISFLDSEALEFLVGMHEELKKRGGSLKLTNVSGICEDILIATRLINLFNIYKDIHQVLRSG